MHLEKYFTGATIPHIYFKDYQHEEFNLDPIEKQVKIVTVLKKCEKIIDDRKKEMQFSLKRIPVIIYQNAKNVSIFSYAGEGAGNTEIIWE